MVIGALGTKAKKIVKFFRKSPRPNVCTYNQSNTYLSGGYGLQANH